jgi:hypothetical protein
VGFAAIKEQTMSKRNLKLVKKTKKVPDSVKQKRVRSLSKRTRILDTRPVLVEVTTQNLTQAEQAEAARFKRLTLRRAALKEKVSRLTNKVKRRGFPKPAA